MPQTQINSLEALLALQGQPVGTSAWLEITQERINQFADATGDQQWLHVDAERAQRESPYGTTIAHGFLTLSLLAQMMSNALNFQFPHKMAINYGLNRVRFVAAVPVGSRVRGQITLQNAEAFPGGYQFTWHITVETADAPKPACVAEWLTRLYV